MADITKNEIRERLGNIEQIRDLLFGHKLQEYEQRFQQCEEYIDKINQDLSVFETETTNHLEQLQESLTTEFRSAINSLEKKLEYLSLTTHEQTEKLTTDIQRTAHKSSQSIESLNQQLTGQTDYLKNDLNQTKNQLQQAMKDLREEVFEVIQQELQELKNNKVSRVDLADFLFELCVKVKSNKPAKDFQETSEIQNNNLLLPEKKATLESVDTVEE